VKRRAKPLKDHLNALTYHFFNKGGKTMATKGYCVKCKEQVEIKNPVESKTSRGTKIAKGKCPKCGTTVCRMGGIKK